MGAESRGWAARMRKRAESMQPVSGPKRRPHSRRGAFAELYDHACIVRAFTLQSVFGESVFGEQWA
eukprot:8940856-Lingulodinium_polyedra.AAC.1